MADPEFGQLELFEGPMCSGKSTKLLSTFFQLKANARHRPIIFAHAKSRDAPSGLIKTRTDLKCPARFVASLGEEQLSIVAEGKYDSVLIDEAQFFTQLGNMELFHFCDVLMSRGVNVYLAALDMDYKRVPWSAITAIRGLSPKATKLAAYCSSCKKDAVYTSRLSESQELIDITATYEPSCRSCYHRQQEKNRAIAI
ncbi:MAG: hypothetical protein BVN35_17675 [Proteobacteria bacterium ST_bin11]|nr:MAG: hypothetical protein BVN35_17675 [Proteobacteria bacterium ST_bin11]